MTVSEALVLRRSASDALSGALAALEGEARREGMREAHAAGVSMIELARLLGISRQRVHELLR